jgi:uncharacterized membrane protein (DUF106 family)
MDTERIEELQQILETSRNEYRKLKKEFDMVLEGKLDDKLGEICKKIDEYVYFELNAGIF